MVDPNRISRSPAETFWMDFCRVLSACASKLMLCITAYRSVLLEQGLARRTEGGGFARGDGVDRVDHGAVGGDVAFFLRFIFILLLNDDHAGVFK